MKNITYRKLILSPRVIGSAESQSYEELFQKACEMRRNPTRAEAVFWNQLKNKRLGYKFRRQHIISGFIVDFYCVEIGLIIEVDGDIHDYQSQRDAERTEILQARGCTIMRFRNEEVIKDVHAAIEVIKKAFLRIKPISERGAD